MAGNWLFSGRRWRDPRNEQDRAVLNAGYDALVARFPAFSRCSHDRYLATISDFSSSWSRVTRHSLPNAPDNPPAKTSDELPPPHGNATSVFGLSIESGAAGLEAQLCGARAVEHIGTMAFPLHLQGGLGAVTFAVGNSCWTAKTEVSSVSLDPSRFQPKRYDELSLTFQLNLPLPPPPPNKVSSGSRDLSCVHGRGHGLGQQRRGPAQLLERGSGMGEVLAPGATDG